MKQKYASVLPKIFLFSFTFFFSQTKYSFTTLGSSNRGFEVVTRSFEGGNIVISDNSPFVSKIFKIENTIAAFFKKNIELNFINTSFFVEVRAEL